MFCKGVVRSRHWQVKAGFSPNYNVHLHPWALVLASLTCLKGHPTPWDCQKDGGLLVPLKVLTRISCKCVVRTQGSPLTETGLASCSGSCSWKRPVIGSRKIAHWPRSPSLGLEIKRHSSSSRSLTPWFCCLRQVTQPLWASAFLSSEVEIIPTCRNVGRTRGGPWKGPGIVSYTFGFLFSRETLWIMTSFSPSKAIYIQRIFRQYGT